MRNGGYRYVCTVDRAEEGECAHAYLARKFTRASAAVWAARFEAGEIEIDGGPADAEMRLRAGASLVWNRPPWIEPEVPNRFDVIYEDADLLVVSKPSGLPTLPGGGFLEHTLLALVRQRVPQATPMHRLGRGTSGLLVFARTEIARSRIQRAFRNREVFKQYLALAAGIVPPQRICAPIGPVFHPKLGRVFAACPDGKISESIVERVQPRGGSSLAQVRIITGRPHQIRIHLAFARHPLLGDPLYDLGGVPRDLAPGLPGDLGYLLHAWRVGFSHPVTGAHMQLEAPPPPMLDVC